MTDELDLIKDVATRLADTQGLDVAYLDRWAGELGVEGLLKEAQKNA